MATAPTRVPLVTSVHGEDRLVVSPRASGIGTARIDLAARRIEPDGTPVTPSRLALYDTVTNLPNRVLFDDRLDQAIEQAERYCRMVALLIIALHWTKTADACQDGESSGDVMQALSLRLNQRLRRSDTVARLSLREFAVILPAVHSGHSAGIVAEKILKLLAAGVDLPEQSAPVTAGIGISLYPIDSATAEIMILNAGAAARHASASGQLSFEYFKHLNVL